MYYFDLLRVGRALRVYAIILFSIVLIELVSMPFSHVGKHDFTIGINGDSIKAHAFTGIGLLHELGQTIHIPFTLLCAAAAFEAVLFATAISTSLARYNGNLHFTFTKPVSRERATLTTIAIDFAAIAVAIVIALVAEFVPLAVVGLLDRITYDPSAVAAILIGLGIAFMWYGMIQAATSLMRGGAGIVAGLSWAVFATLGALEGLTPQYVPGFIVDAIHALNTLNPQLYLTTLFSRVSYADPVRNAFGGGYMQDLTIVWVTALVAVAIALGLRRRMEA
jgi:hypothetical protein